jgi:hypothetical protein
MSPTIVSVVGCIAPAPSPCNARNAISVPMPPASPLAMEPTRKTPMPASSTGLRPYRSASFP